MKKKILLVEDDELFRTALKNILVQKYDVIEASNGKMAKDLMVMSLPDLVLSDIQMPHLSGIDLLGWIKKNKPVPVILMTGFSHILETKKAVELGADDFVPKPFEAAELFAKMDSILVGLSKDQSQEEVRTIDLDREFCKVPIEDFICEQESDYAIYIRISNNKYVKIAHKGGKLSSDKISIFKEKGVNYLYIHQSDFSKLVGFTLLAAKAVLSSGQVEKAKKTRFMQYTGEMLMQKVFVQGTDEDLFNNAKDFMLTSLDLLTEDQESFTILNLLSSHTDFLYAHSLGVSIISVMIAKQLGWQSPQTLFKVAISGLFHDIGKKEIPREILEKPRSLLTQAERTMLESHTTRGKEILESMRTAPSEVIQVAYEHHEDALGQGYPRGIDHQRVHPISIIVGVADAFCNYTILNPQIDRPLSASEAIRMMEKFKINSLDKRTFEALTQMIRRSAA